MLVGVDKRIWCYASEYFGDIWNRMGRKKNNGKSPHQMVTEYVAGRIATRQLQGELGASRQSGSQDLKTNELSSETGLMSQDTTIGLLSKSEQDNIEEESDSNNTSPDHGVESDEEEGSTFVETEGLPPFKRFGCLCYTMRLPRKQKKMETEWIKSVFLGLDHQSSNYLVGCYVGENFTEVRTKNVKFLEHVQVSTLGDLKDTSRKYEDVVENGLERCKASSEAGIYLIIFRR